MNVMVVMLGLVLGSFYNVVAYRVPRRESVAYPPSHCPQCQHRLGALELVPVISFLGLRGRCRRCGSRISWRYPLVEALTGVLFWWGYRAYGLTARTPLFWALSSLALLLALIFQEKHEGRAVPPEGSVPATAGGGPAGDEKGFTLIEVLAALMVLGLVAVSAIGLYGASARAQKQASVLANATSLGQSVMEGVHYAASLGALGLVPSWLPSLPIERDGTTFHVAIQVKDQPESDTLKRVEVTVSWDQPTPSSLNLVTLVTEADLSGDPGKGKPGNGGSEDDEPGDGDSDDGKHGGGKPEGGKGPDSGKVPEGAAWGLFRALAE